MAVALFGCGTVSSGDRPDLREQVALADPQHGAGVSVWETRAAVWGRAGMHLYEMTDAGFDSVAIAVDERCADTSLGGTTIASRCFDAAIGDELTQHWLRVFERIDVGTLASEASIALDPNLSALTGTSSIAAQTGRIVVGLTAPQESDPSTRGAAVDFARTSDGWSAGKMVQPVDRTGGFGASVALDRETLVVADVGHPDVRGAWLYLFEDADGTWEQAGAMDLEMELASIDVALAFPRVAVAVSPRQVGAPSQLLVFELDGQTLEATFDLEFDDMRWPSPQVAIGTDFIVVADHDSASVSGGAALVWTRSHDGWSRFGSPLTGSADHQFGVDVSASGRLFAVGSPGRYSSVEGAVHFYTFK